MTASRVMAAYEYPTFATSEFNLVFYLLAGGFLWFIPVALCAAEMATIDGWQTVGIFAWVVVPSRGMYVAAQKGILPAVCELPLS